uniref:Endoglucanase n=1 Tax=Lilium longiflorum TaxID=4690 RepID=Q7XB15_LILLO|nr:endo-1,4-beta-glucanase [Lilium longiflorum]
MLSLKIVILGLLVAISDAVAIPANINYKDALSKSIIFFEGQRSGKLPPNQTLTWRANSALSDGAADNVDLTGGYYDAGDNVKFGFPMAFSVTMLSWSVIEFGKLIPADIDKAREAIRWGTDYLLKACSALPDAIYVQVGDPTSEHQCWERPENMSTQRSVYKITPSNPGSDVAGETAAALAAASLVFHKIDHKYAKTLRETAKKAFTFAESHRGSYSDSLSSAVCPYYCSYSGFQDELLWAAGWLYKATHNASYLNFAQSLNVDSNADTFSWDNKFPGADILLAQDFIINKNQAASSYKQQAEKFLCTVLPNSPTLSAKYTAGGLLYKMTPSNLQYVTSTSFLLGVYAKYLRISRRTFSCGNMVVTPSVLIRLVEKQIGYILGHNPQALSYMVDFGNNFPLHIHHRGSSIPSVHADAQAIGCDEGFQYYNTSNPNPNILTGAVVGGPDENDSFADDRDNYSQSEPATYINAPLVGTLAFLAGDQVLGKLF